MWSNRQKMHDADAERARQNLPEPTGLWRVPGAHVAAMGASFGDRVGGAVSVHSLEDKKGAELHGMIPSSWNHSLLRQAETARALLALAQRWASRHHVQ